MTITIASSLWSLQQLALTKGASLDDLIDIAADIGVSAIELNEDFLRLPPYASIDGYRRLRNRIESRGLSVASIWFYTDIPAAVRLTSVEETIHQIGNYLGIASILGCPRITLPPGEGGPNADFDLAHAAMIDVLTQLMPVAEHYKVDIGLEIGRTTGNFQTPQAALALVDKIASDRLRIVPDFEAWRHATEDLPLSHVETTVVAEPASLDDFRKCLPYAPLIHAKLLRLDDAGNDWHFPLEQLMAAVRESGRDHVLDIEFEGWIPDIDPHCDSVVETRRCVELIRRLSHS